MNLGPILVEVTDLLYRSEFPSASEIIRRKTRRGIIMVVWKYAGYGLWSKESRKRLLMSAPRILEMWHLKVHQISDLEVSKWAKIGVLLSLIRKKLRMLGSGTEAPVSSADASGRMAMDIEIFMICREYWEQLDRAPVGISRLYCHPAQ